jgi:type IV pilus assembly protein PilE
LTATAVTGTSQASDTPCTAMSIAQTNTGLQYTPSACWKK